MTILSSIGAVYLPSFPRFAWERKFRTLCVLVIPGREASMLCSHAKRGNEGNEGRRH